MTATKHRIAHHLALHWTLLLAICYTRLVNGQAPVHAAQSSSINLAAILEHQEGLALECAKLQERELRQVEHLLASERDHAKRTYLPRPLQIKLPAVCLFLSTQVGHLAPPALATSSRLEFVNWNLDEDEIGQSVRNLSKRAAKSFDLSPPANNIYDPEASYAEYNELGQGNELAKFHQDVDNMLDDKRYKEIVDQNRPKIAGHLSPVILVPGLLGSRLQARIVNSPKRKRVNIFCSKQSDWQDAWLSVRQLLPIAVDCWLDNVRLVADTQTGWTSQPPGVEVRVPDFGSVESVRHLDQRQPKMTKYYAPLIDHYEKLGYTVDKNLLAAPYDFRLAPPKLTDYFEALRELVERAQQESTSGKKVTLVCHSMGCTNLLVFLRQQSAAWRQAHVRKLIALSSPWGGAVKSLKALVVGDQLELPLVSDAKMRKLARTFPSIAYLLPQEQIFMRQNRYQPTEGGPILVQTPNRDYRVKDLGDLMRDLGLEHQYMWHKESSKLIKPLEPLPDVHVDCIHGLNAPTPETILFKNQTDFPDGQYELITGNGDGTVNFESLMVCADWAAMLPDKVKHLVVLDTNHVGVIGHKSTLTHITDDVMID